MQISAKMTVGVSYRFRRAVKEGLKVWEGYKKQKSTRFYLYLSRSFDTLLTQCFSKA
jgi:hypothetical protein